jgi:hypothetical protein
MLEPADGTLGAEDAKLVTLARGARARIAAADGAAVRDQDGRTYAAATVALPSLSLSALSWRWPRPPRPVRAGWRRPRW